MPVPMPPAAVAVLPRRRAAVARVTRLATSATTLRVGNSLSPLAVSVVRRRRHRWGPGVAGGWAPLSGHRQPLPPCRRAAIAPVGCGVYTSKRPRSPASQMHPYSIFERDTTGVHLALSCVKDCAVYSYRTYIQISTSDRTHARTGHETPRAEAQSAHTITNDKQQPHERTPLTRQTDLTAHGHAHTHRTYGFMWCDTVL